MTNALTNLLAEREAVTARLREIRSIGHHERRWVFGSRPPPATQRRLQRAALDAITENLELLAKLDEQIEQVTMPEDAS